MFSFRSGYDSERKGSPCGVFIIPQTRLPGDALGALYLHHDYSRWIPRHQQGRDPKSLAGYSRWRVARLDLGCVLTLFQNSHSGLLGFLLDCGCGSRGLRTCRRDRPTAFGSALAGLDIAHRPRPYGQDGAHANALPDHVWWSRQLTATPLAAALSSVRVLTPTSLNGSQGRDSQAAIRGCWQRKSSSQRKTPLGWEGRLAKRRRTATSQR